MNPIIKEFLRDLCEWHLREKPDHFVFNRAKDIHGQFDRWAQLEGYDGKFRYDRGKELKQSVADWEARHGSGEASMTTFLLKNS